VNGYRDPLESDKRKSYNHRDKSLGLPGFECVQFGLFVSAEGGAVLRLPPEVRFFRHGRANEWSSENVAYVVDRAPGLRTQIPEDPKVFHRDFCEVGVQNRQWSDNSVWLRETGRAGVTGMLVWIVVCGSSVLATPVGKRVIRPAEQQAVTFGSNGELDQVDGRHFVGWNGYGTGYEVDTSVRHAGGASARCTNMSRKDRHGISQLVDFGTGNLAPIVVGGWSRARDVSGTPDSS